MNNNGHNEDPFAGKKLFIAAPIYWQVDPYFYKSSIQLVYDIIRSGLPAAFKPQFGDSAIGRARNSLTRQFLETDCTHMLFIDSDFVFSTEQILRMMEHPEPIVGGLYLKKQDGPPQLVLNALDDMPPMRADHMQQVKYIGTGFIRVAREVFEKMIEVYGDEISYQCDHDNKITEWDFWQMGVYKYKDGTKRWLSEDWYFCQRALDLGYEIWADMHVLLKHSGGQLYPTKEQEDRLYGRFKMFEAFDCPKECSEGANEVFSGQYEFGITFEKNPRIIDIGANCGAFAHWAHWKWPGSVVHCYEPNGEIFEVLKSNCAKVGATAVNSAVGDPARNKLFVGNKTPLVSGQYKTNLNGNRVIDITVVEPDSLPEADLIKIDAEGAEPVIVNRMTNLPHYLLVEYHTAENKTLVLKQLAGKMIVVGDKRENDGHGVLALRKISHC